VQTHAFEGECGTLVAGNFLRGNGLLSHLPASRLNAVLFAFLDDAATVLLHSHGDVSSSILAGGRLDSSRVAMEETPVLGVGVAGRREGVRSESLMQVLAEERIVIAGHRVNKFAGQQHFLLRFIKNSLLL